MKETNDNQGKRNRRAHIPSIEKSYTCKICKRSYLSFPALYTHKRNKHNIIPITGKPSLFKRLNFSVVGKFNSGAIKMDINIKNVISNIICKYKDISTYLFKSSDLVTFNPDYNYIDDRLYLKLIEMISSEQQINIPKPQEKVDIHTMIAIYLILIMEITLEKDFLDKLLIWAILLKEVINMCGLLHEVGFYKANPGRVLEYEYCQLTKIEEVPCLINDYLEFIKLEKNSFGFSLSEHADLSLNFCYWLFNHEYSSFKLIPFN